jgi:two-component system, sensor histidine kinase
MPAPDAAVLSQLRDRLRAGLWISLTSITAFALADLALWHADLTPLLALKLLQVAFILVALPLLRRARTLRAATAVAVPIVASIYVTTAASGIATADFSTSPFLLVAFATATAALLPWGGGAQLVTVVVAASAMLVNVLAVTGGPAAAATYPALGVAVALAGSVYVAHERTRGRREYARTAVLLAGQSRVLEMVARDVPLREILESLALLVESCSPGLLCSVLLLEDGRLRHGGAPSLPESYTTAIDGVAIGPRVGSCGTAVYRREPVVVTDIASDPLWTDYREVGLAHGLRACWSAPILSSDGRCLGTFAMYYRTPRSPRDDDWHRIAVAAHLAGLAIERRQTEEALAQSKRELEDESRISGALARVGQAMISSLSAPELLDRLCELTTDLLGCDCSATTLRQSDDVYVPQSAHGYPPDELEALRLLRLSSPAMAGLLALLDDQGLVQVKTERVEDAMTAALLRRHRISVSVYVPLRRGDEVIGILFAGLRDRSRTFTPLEQRIAMGIAHVASMALENARLVAELRRANLIKSEFVSTMSHELRTPLSVILGYTDILGDTLREDDHSHTLDRIRRSGLELLEMVEATLDLNRLETGRDPIQPERVEVRALLDELASEFAAVGRSPATVLQWHRGDDVQLCTDRRKLKIILKNLVGNALKFTPAGEVVVRCQATESGAVLRVRDTGIGIDEAQIPIIFEMFRQVDGSDSRSHGGVGLGLYITRRLVAQLGGDIQVESVVGRGTTFTVTLPGLAEDTALSATA